MALPHLGPPSLSKRIGNGDALTVLPLAVPG